MTRKDVEEMSEGYGGLDNFRNYLKLVEATVQAVDNNSDDAGEKFVALMEATLIVMARMGMPQRELATKAAMAIASYPLYGKPQLTVAELDKALDTLPAGVH